MAAAGSSPVQPACTHSFGIELGLQRVAAVCGDDGECITAVGSRVVMIQSDVAGSDAATSPGAALPAQRYVPQHPVAKALCCFAASTKQRLVVVIEVIDESASLSQGSLPTVVADATVAGIDDPDTPSSLSSLIPRGKAVASTYEIPHAGGGWQFPLLARFVSPRLVFGGDFLVAAIVHDAFLR